MRKILCAALAFAVFAPALAAQESNDPKNQLTRDEVAVFKKKLVTALDAMGCRRPASPSRRTTSACPPSSTRRKGNWYPTSAMPPANWP